VDAADQYLDHLMHLAGTISHCLFVSLPDLARPEDVLRLAPLAAAFAWGSTQNHLCIVSKNSRKRAKL
jgi:hypothetical protein